MKKIEENYELKCKTISDINEHLPILKKYAEECDVVIEMGVRNVVSTWALLLANPKKLISIDLYNPAYYGPNDLELVQNCAVEYEIDFEFVIGNVLNMEISECDLLFIDTLHNYNQLKQELSLHSNKVKKYIIFHDTESFRFKGETNNENGIWPAIEEFLEENKHWSVCEIFTNNNGLTIIKNNG